MKHYVNFRKFTSQKYSISDLVYPDYIIPPHYAGRLHDFSACTDVLFQDFSALEEIWRWLSWRLVTFHDYSEPDNIANAEGWRVKADLAVHRRVDVHRFAPSPSWHSRSWPAPRCHAHRLPKKIRRTTPTCRCRARELPHPDSWFLRPNQPHNNTSVTAASMQFTCIILRFIYYMTFITLQ